MFVRRYFIQFYDAEDQMNSVGREMKKLLIFVELLRMLVKRYFIEFYDSQHQNWRGLYWRNVYCCVLWSGAICRKREPTPWDTMKRPYSLSLAVRILGWSILSNLIRIVTFMHSIINAMAQKHGHRSYLCQIFHHWLYCSSLNQRKASF